MGKRVHLACCAGIFDDKGELWLISWNFRAIIKVKFENEKLQTINYFESNKLYLRKMYTILKKDVQSFYLIPLLESCFFQWDKKEMKFIDAPILFKKEKIFKVFEYGKNTIFMLLNGDIWYFDKQTKKWSINKKLSEKINCLKKDNSNDLFNFEISNYDEYIIFLNKSKKKAILYNIETKKEICYFFENVFQKIDKVFFDGEYIWITLFEELDVLRFNPKTKEKRKFQAQGNEWGDLRKFEPYTKIMRYNNKIIFLNYYSRYIMWADSSDYTLKKLFDFPSEYQEIQNCEYGPCFSEGLFFNDSIYFIPLRASMLIKYSEIDQSVVGYDFSVSLKSIGNIEDIIRDELYENGVITENKEYHNIENLIKICDRSYKDKYIQVGERIYSQTKKANKI